MRMGKPLLLNARASLFKPFHMPAARKVYWNSQKGTCTYTAVAQPCMQVLKLVIVCRLFGISVSYYSIDILQRSSNTHAQTCAH